VDETSKRLYVADTLRSHIEDLTRQLEWRAENAPTTCRPDDPGCIFVFQPTADILQGGSVVCPGNADGQIVSVDRDWLHEMGVGVGVNLGTDKEDRTFEAICSDLEPYLRRRGADIPTSGKTAMGRLMVWAATIIGIEPVGPLMAQPVGPDNEMVWAKLPADNDPRRALAFAVRWFLDRPKRVEQYQNLLECNPQATREEIAEHLGVDEKYVPQVNADAAKSVCAASVAPPASERSNSDEASCSGQGSEKPVWSKAEKSLTFRGKVVRRVGRPGRAFHVVTILDSFEESGWPSELNSLA